MFTKQTGLLEALRGLIPEQAIDILKQTYHNCAQALFHRAPVNVEVDGGKLHVPARSNTQTFEQYFSALNISNQSSYYDLSADDAINGAAANFAGVTVMQPSNYVQGNSTAFKTGVENNVVLAFLNGGVCMAPSILATTIYDIDGTSAITISGSTTTFATIYVTVAIGAQANRVPQVWFDAVNAAAQPVANAFIAIANLNNNGLRVLDTNASHYLIISPGSDLSANRTLTVTTGDADRTLTISGDATISGTNTGDQNLFSTIAVSGQSNVVADSTGDTLTLVAGSGITITTDAGADSVTISASGGGTGDVVGPSSATDNAIARYDGTTGKLIQNSVVTIADTTGNMAGVGTLASAAHTITSASATALAVGANGTTNPVFTVNAATGSVATGVSITGAAAAGGVAVAVTSSGTNEALTLDAKGSGTITLGGTSTGAIILDNATTLNSTLTGGSTSDITINTNKFTVAASTGNTVIAGTLSVGGVTFQSLIDRIAVLEAFSSVTDVNYNSGTGVLKQTKSTPIGSPSDSTIDTAEAC